MDQQVWEAICTSVYNLRKLPEDEYVKRCGLDAHADADRILELYRGRRLLTPDYLATLLEDVTAEIKRQFPGENTDVIKTAIAACAYGPRLDDGPPDLTHLETDVAQWTLGNVQRALERMLVHGARLPRQAGGAPNWEHCWPQAFRTLLYMVESGYFERDKYSGPGGDGKRPRHGDIQGNLRWIENNGIAEQAVEQAPVYAAIIRGSLVLGCTCYEGWEDVRLASETEARTACERHNLEAWDAREPLNDFIWTAGIHSNLPRLNGFRHGILAKEVTREHNLAVFYVLICGKEGCGGEIQRDDRCDRCGYDAGAKRWTYRLDGKEERQPWLCWRCPQCDRLFFQGRHHCPKCDHPTSRRPTTVWVPRDGSFDVDDLRDDDRAWTRAFAERLCQVLSQFGDLEPQDIYRIVEVDDSSPVYADRLRQLAFLVFGEGHSEQGAAREMGIPENEFKGVWKHTMRLLTWQWRELYGEEGPETLGTEL